MVQKRNPHAANNFAVARVSDITRAEIDELAEKTGMPKSKITRMVIVAGLPKVKAELLKPDPIQPG